MSWIGAMAHPPHQTVQLLPGACKRLRLVPSRTALHHPTATRTDRDQPNIARNPARRRLPLNTTLVACARAATDGAAGIAVIPVEARPHGHRLIVTVIVTAP